MHYYSIISEPRGEKSVESVAQIISAELIDNLFDNLKKFADVNEMADWAMGMCAHMHSRKLVLQMTPSIYLEKISSGSS